MKIRSLRAFIGSEDFDVSRSFYTDLGFEELRIGESMSYFRMGNFGFYLQQYHVKDWVENSMLFLEVEDLDKVHQHILSLDLPSTYERVRISDIQQNDWGDEFFVHDPAGILWHIGCFNVA